MCFEGVITNTSDAIQGHDDELETIAVGISMNVIPRSWARVGPRWHEHRPSQCRPRRRAPGQRTVLGVSTSLLA